MIRDLVKCKKCEEKGKTATCYRRVYPKPVMWKCGDCKDLYPMDSEMLVKVKVKV